MTRDDIISMAREARLVPERLELSPKDEKALVRFAALVAAAELRRLLDRRVRTLAIETQTPTRGTQPSQSVQGATHEPTQ